jgi:glyoxylase-like metal-dependent hydrolase (beta-lactamase superfamily II)
MPAGRGFGGARIHRHGGACLEPAAQSCLEREPKRLVPATGVDSGWELPDSGSAAIAPGAAMTDPPHIRAFFDEPTRTVTYLAWDGATRAGVVIDPLLDFSAASGEVGIDSAEAVLAVSAAEKVEIRWVLETHVHADHLSAAQLIKARTGALVGIGAGICAVQRSFAPMFGAAEVVGDGREFDRLFDDGDRLEIGDMVVEIMAVPGHTPADIAYRIGDAVFVGDTLFMPDFGTARTDFPGGDAGLLYRSIRRLLGLPPKTRLFMCHDYKAPGRDFFAWETNVETQRRDNVHVRDGIGEDEFAAMRRARDAGLAPPALLFPAIQVNMRAGRFPPPAADGLHYLRLPVRPPPELA